MAELRQGSPLIRTWRMIRHRCLTSTICAFHLGFGLVDQQPQRYRSGRNELIKRLEADTCEMCGSTVDVEVHHIRALRDLNAKGQREKPKWVQIMAARKRKTLVVCRTCHMDIHHGRSNPQSQR